MTKLRKPLYATGIHGITGQDIDTSHLPADTLVKDARQCGTMPEVVPNAMEPDHATIDTPSTAR